VCDAVLGEAFSVHGGERFARAGAMATDAVSRWTGLPFLRFRYLMKEADAEQFAEVVVLAAFERGENGPALARALRSRGRRLAETAEPRANISRRERAEHVARALAVLGPDARRRRVA
jgi:hypothetical protein